MSKYKGEFKLIDSKEKAYILGLIAADGNLYYNKTSGAYQVKIKLKEEDVTILQRIHQLFNFFTTPKAEVHRNNKRYFYIYCYNKELFTDIKNLGVYERKSFENSNKLYMPNLSKNSYYFSYILGFLDGDGTINQSKSGHVRIDVSGANKNLYIQISNFLKKHNIISRVVFRADRNYHMLRISGKSNVKKLITKLQENDFCIDRKFKPYFFIDWSRIPGRDNRTKKYEILFVTWQN